MFDGSVSSDSSALPLQRIVESLMRGNAENQAQAQVKDLASKQADGAAKLQVTMTADPNDPGNPFVHIKNAKADQLNQTQGKDLEAAYDTPKRNTEAAIANMNRATLPTGQFETNALRSVGYPPEATDKTASDLQTFNQNYRAQRDLGEGVISAALKAGVARTGLWNRDKIAEDLDRQASVKNATAFRVAAEPIIQEQDRQQRLNRSEAQFQQTTNRQAQLEADAQRRMSDNEQKTAYTRWNTIKDKTDWTSIPRDQRRQAFDDQNDTGIMPSEQVYNQIDRAAERQVKQLYNDFFIAKSETYHLGNFPTFEAAKSAYGHEFTDKNEEARARNAWETANAYEKRQATYQSLRDENAAARLALEREKLANGSTTKLDDSAVKLFSVDDLLAADPGKVKNLDQAVARKAALLRDQVQTESDKMRALNAKIADAKKRDSQRTFPTGDPATADLQADFAISMRKVQDAKAGLAKIQARNKPSAATAPPQNRRILSKTEALQLLKQ